MNDCFCDFSLLTRIWKNSNLSLKWARVSVSVHLPATMRIVERFDWQFEWVQSISRTNDWLRKRIAMLSYRSWLLSNNTSNVKNVSALCDAFTLLILHCDCLLWREALENATLVAIIQWIAIQVEASIVRRAGESIKESLSRLISSVQAAHR